MMNVSEAKGAVEGARKELPPKCVWHPCQACWDRFRKGAGLSHASKHVLCYRWKMCVE